MAISLFTGSKGVQSIISAFLLVVVFITVLLLLIYFNYEGVVRSEELSKAPFFLENSSQLKDGIENCLNILEKNELSQVYIDLNSCMPKQAKGYFIERFEAYDCTFSRLETGTNSPCDHVLTYYLNLPERKTKNCLARLTVCVDDRV